MSLEKLEKLAGRIEALDQRLRQFEENIQTLADVAAVQQATINNLTVFANGLIAEMERAATTEDSTPQIVLPL